jgi:hypothetical protein
VRSSLSGARASLGVCPQFDVLWEELTGREHLRLFADLRGLPAAGGREAAEALLAQVGLADAADARASTYSGGMRRRLSLALALLGDPQARSARRLRRRQTPAPRYLPPASRCPPSLQTQHPPSLPSQRIPSQNNLPSPTGAGPR